MFRAQVLSEARMRSVSMSVIIPWIQISRVEWKSHGERIYRNSWICVAGMEMEEFREESGGDKEKNCGIPPIIIVSTR